MIDFRDLRTVKQLAGEIPWITESKLRWWIFHRDKNGFSAVLVKIGGRLYISIVEFNKWLEAQRLVPTAVSQAA